MAINTDYWINCSIEEIGLDADHLYKQLLGDQCFCITDICPPNIDLSSDEFTIKIDQDSPLFSYISKLDINELTNRDETGAFDVIAKSVKSLIREEFEGGRITGADYSKSYTALLEVALSNSVQFLLNKDKSYWESQQGQFDAMAKKVGIELIKAQISQSQMESLNQQVNYANGKISLMTQKENYCTAVANREITIAKNAELQDTQIDLYKQQIVSYKRDSEVKAARIFTDAWITMKTIDEGLLAPDGFTNEHLDDVLKSIKDKNEFFRIIE